LIGETALYYTGWLKSRYIQFNSILFGQRKDQFNFIWSAKRLKTIVIKVY